MIKQGCGFLVFIVLVLCLFFSITDEKKDYAPPTVHQSHTPDSTREVDHYDFDALKFVYKDGVIVSVHLKLPSSIVGEKKYLNQKILLFVGMEFSKLKC